MRVRACSNAGCGDWSLPENATPAATPGALPAKPSGLGANGKIVSGMVSLWWLVSTTGPSTDYNLRYAVETCDPTPCRPGEWKEVNGISATRKKLSAGSGSTSQLSPSTVYRLQVRATNAYGQSAWSDIAFVYPTSSAPRASRKLPLIPPSSPPEIATAPLYGYQPTNATGVHEFRFIICDGTIPSGVTINAAQIETAIEKWEDAVKKNSSNSMIRTTRAYHPTPAPKGACAPSDGLGPSGLFPSGKNEVMFVDDAAIHKLWCEDAPACWRSKTWDNVWKDSWNPLAGVRSLPSIAKGTILLRETRFKGGTASDWNALAYSGAPCKYVEHTIVHEVGHALGIGWPLNGHPRNSTLAVMSAGKYGGDRNYCEPQAYDILAIMANYQSR